MRKIDYGIDGPAELGSAFVGGVICLGIGFRLAQLHRGWIGRDGGAVLDEVGMVLLLSALLFLLYVRVGKFLHRDRLLDLAQFTGRERVLDVGTGRGLLLIGAAKRLPNGRAIGIDLWRSGDLWDNNEQHTRRNIELEAVADRVELHLGDARQLDFADASFDVIFSNLCLHNIASAADRAGACREIARLLKPGGIALISDYRYTGDYAETFRQARLAVTRGAPDVLHTFPPLRIVRAVKENPV